ncbi:MauE/DoxX family redox-associated membrane protein [Sphingomicrobium astaxanthinifaciens]|uniref:MauE/DoxX family redox-associated membrane protein n=1 Tax=Sphingomicrobium astaxanthinifaciens TaxID=1227949 RepID=UPI001FCC6619|nr:MauE/DoxX family redox-associated membrane protein [Sphingomicrobium astaxanthinifaciens]MCJ7421903.1 glutaredoxin [Sphingomicrobium astaxanthinifaciens]
MLDQTPRTARLYRMVKDKHVCPYGLQALHLLKSRGYVVEDHRLRSAEETEAFKAEHGVKTTPQIWIGEQRIGGYTDLRAHLGLKNPDPDNKTYRPVAALFALAALMAVALTQLVTGAPFLERWTMLFVPIAMCLLALLKLQDVRSFATMFLGYDLLARRWVPYASLYPFLEAAAGVLMLGKLLPWLSVPIALFIGTIGAASVFKAVYVDKRDLKCACVGGNNNVPLGFISLTENLMMVGMGLWMGSRYLW